MAEREWPPFQKGVACCIAMFLLFWWLSAIFVQGTSGISYLARDCALRFLVGAAGLWVFVKGFHKGTWTNVLYFRNFKEGLRPGAGLFLIMLLQVFLLVMSLVRDNFNVGEDLTVQYLLLQPLAVGFYEEMAFRGYLLEGYFSSENKTQRTRLGYALLSFVIFGLPHIIGCDSAALALVRFFVTGATGVIFAAMYLYSHNLLSCMAVHFVYNVFLRIVSSQAAWYTPVQVALVALAFLIAVPYVIKVPLEERIEEK